MKALSLWQPWASLIATGAKRWETRSWATSYRGPLLIHATKGGLPRGELSHMLCRWIIQGALGPLIGREMDLSSRTWPGVAISHLPFGVAVATCDLVDIRPTHKLTLEEIGKDQPFGDFSPYRFAWKLENARPTAPILMRGQRGLWEVDAGVLKTLASEPQE